MNYKIINFRKAVYIFGELFNKKTFFVIKYFQFKKDSAMLIFVTVYICTHNNCMIDTQYLHIHVYSLNRLLQRINVGFHLIL